MIGGREGARTRGGVGRTPAPTEYATYGPAVRRTERDDDDDGDYDTRTAGRTQPHGAPRPQTLTHLCAHIHTFTHTCVYIIRTHTRTRPSHCRRTCARCSYIVRAHCACPAPPHRRRRLTSYDDVYAARRRRPNEREVNKVTTATEAATTVVNSADAWCNLPSYYYYVLLLLACQRGGGRGKRGSCLLRSVGVILFQNILKVCFCNF